MGDMQSLQRKVDAKVHCAFYIEPRTLFQSLFQLKSFYIDLLIEVLLFFVLHIILIERHFKKTKSRTGPTL